MTTNTTETNATWTFDPTHSSIAFAVKHMVFAKVRGRFSAWSGELTTGLDGDWASGKVRVAIDAASIDTNVADRDTHLRSADFFDAEAFPQLAFESTRVEPDGGDRYRVFGNLTIRDITREVVLHAELGGTGKDPWGNDRVAFTAKGSIDRHDFGLAWNQVLETGGLLVGRNIDIDLDVQAVLARNAEAA
jgi:polyisoprenoid-binding protein YceI